MKTLYLSNPVNKVPKCDQLLLLSTDSTYLLFTYLAILAIL